MPINFIILSGGQRWGKCQSRTWRLLFLSYHTRQLLTNGTLNTIRFIDTERTAYYADHLAAAQQAILDGSPRKCTVIHWAEVRRLRRTSAQWIAPALLAQAMSDHISMMTGNASGVGMMGRDTAGVGATDTTTDSTSMTNMMGMSDTMGMNSANPALSAAAQLIQTALLQIQGMTGGVTGTTAP